MLAWSFEKLTDKRDDITIETFDLDAIRSILPHRDPMLLIQGAEKHSSELGTEARAFYQVRGDEYFLQGHFPGNPVVPGVILCEMMGQAACVLVADQAGSKTPYFTGMDRVKFKQKVLPGDRIEIRSVLEKAKAPFFFIKSDLYVQGKLCATAQLSFALI